MCLFDVREGNKRLWRVDETYVRVKGKWVYLSRGVDSTGATIDFLLSAKRDAAAAERFLTKTSGGENHPRARGSSTPTTWGAWRTIASYEAIHMIRKGQVYGSAAGAQESTGVSPPNPNVQDVTHNITSVHGIVLEKVAWIKAEPLSQSERINERTYCSKVGPTTGRSKFADGEM